MRKSGVPKGTLQLLVFITMIAIVWSWKLVILLFKGLGIGIGHLIRVYSKNSTCNLITNFEQVDKMDGHEFEYYVASLLQNNGYQDVEVTKASGDFGVDILAKKNQTLWAFQCKCYHSKLGVHSVQEIYSGAAKYGADIAVVVTNNYFTSAAAEMAQDLSVELWDREMLGRLMT